MKATIGKFIKTALLVTVSAVLILGGCKQTSDDAAATVDLGALINGSSDDDGAKTATFVDGVSRLDAVDSKPYLFTGLLGVGKFEVKSVTSGWANVTDTTMSVMDSGSDKIGKLQLELVGTAQNYEVAYNIGDSKNISGSVFSVKMYIPPVYTDTAATAYPVLSFSVKNSSWITFAFAKINTFKIGSGWKTIAIDFVNKTLSVDGAAIAAADCDLLDFSAANMGGLTDAKLVVMGFYGDALPSTMTDAFYIDYLDISGFADPVLATPVIGSGANAALTAYEVTITGPAGADIWYTTDGTTAPTSGAPSLLYAGPFAITADTTVKAIAVQTGFANSLVATKVCTYVNPVTVVPDTASIASFETGVDGLDTGDAAYDAACTAVSQNTVADYVKLGAGSLKADANFTDSGWTVAGKSAHRIFWNSTGGKDLQNKEITMWVNIPVGMNGFKLNLTIKNASWGSIYDHGWASTLATGWNQIIVPATATTAAGFATAYEMDIEICAAGVATFNGSYYIDAIDAK